MSKAYDRIEWQILLAITRKLGFSERWVYLVNQCISTISYFIVLNGYPSEPFFPQRGLRQGDPIFPYLFVICAEGFLALLKKAKERN